MHEGGVWLFRAAGVSLPLRAEALAVGPATLALRPHLQTLRLPGQPQRSAGQLAVG